MITKKMNTRDKVQIVANSPEVVSAVKLLIALMQDAELKNFITYEYEMGSEKYNFTFNKLSPIQTEAGNLTPENILHAMLYDNGITIPVQIRQLIYDCMIKYKDQEFKKATSIQTAHINDQDQLIYDLQKEVSELKAENEGLNLSIQQMGEESIDITKYQDAQKQIQQLKEGLLKYATHSEDCVHHVNPFKSPACTCGLTEILNKIK